MHNIKCKSFILSFEKICNLEITSNFSFFSQRYSLYYRDLLMKFYRKNFVLLGILFENNWKKMESFLSQNYSGEYSWAIRMTWHLSKFHIFFCNLFSILLLLFFNPRKGEIFQKEKNNTMGKNWRILRKRPIQFLRGFSPFLEEDCRK